MADEPKAGETKSAAKPTHEKAEPKKVQPVILVHRFGYWINEDDPEKRELKMWLGGQYVDDPKTIADLTARGAHLTPAPEQK